MDTCLNLCVLTKSVKIFKYIMKLKKKNRNQPTSNLKPLSVLLFSSHSVSYSQV